jgi:hypothetical protein
VHLDASGENYLGFAFSRTPVDDATKDDTNFGIHDRVGHWVHDFTQAKTPQFATWAKASVAGSGEAPPPVNTP